MVLGQKPGWSEMQLEAVCVRLDVTQIHRNQRVITSVVKILLWIFTTTDAYLRYATQLANELYTGPAS